MSRAPRVVLDTNVPLFSTLVYLVTGDRDLPSLAGEFSCPIVIADQFLSTLTETLDKAA
jgi:predicted nucleic acid-binding protein